MVKIVSFMLCELYLKHMITKEINEKKKNLFSGFYFKEKPKSLYWFAQPYMIYMYTYHPSACSVLTPCSFLLQPHRAL